MRSLASLAAFALAACNGPSTALADVDAGLADASAVDAGAADAGPCGQVIAPGCVRTLSCIFGGVIQEPNTPRAVCRD
jgi:hypothetical protein